MLLFAANQLLAQSDTTGPRLFFFTMDHCPPCAQVRPEIERIIAAGYPVTTIDARTNPAWTQHFQVATTPTLILVCDNQVVQRHSGILTGEQMVGWFQAISASRPTPPPDPRTAPMREADRQSGPVVQSGATEPHSATAGTREAGSQQEVSAMRATVRLRVEDAEGFSFATGTVIHSHGPEAVVLTCGHVFRDGDGAGKITADIGWVGSGSPQTVPGQLLHFDAGPCDVALVLIRPGFEVPFVELAPGDARIARGAAVFTIGCDQGQPPTIRRTQIKDHSNYDGVDKYDIVGRPAIGRSGGGLFASDGRLIGVCNAAAVDFDEGIYSSLPNIWRELALTRVDRVLQTRTEIASAGTPLSPPNGMSGNGPGADLSGVPEVPRVGPSAPPVMTPVSLASTRGPGHQELILVVRDRLTGQNQTVVFDDPQPELIRWIQQQAGGQTPGGRSPEQSGGELESIADLRQTMPVLPVPENPATNNLRAQSPDGGLR